MILQALTKYYEALEKKGEIGRPGWATTKINYALCLDLNGRLCQIIPMVEDTGAKKPQPRQFILPAPVKRTVGIEPNFLWDNSSYMLGIDAKGKPDRSILCFEACKEHHHKLLDECDSILAKSILAFFDNWEPEMALSNDVLQANEDVVSSGGNLLFRVDGVFAHEDDGIRRAWQNHYDHKDGMLRQCLVTGKEDVIVPVHPSIKGVDGAQSSGAAIVSFNAPAFCSYGQEQNYNAPVGSYAAFAYTSALNYLLSDRANVQKIGDTSIVCWAENAEPQYRAFTFAALFGGQEETFDENALKDAVRKLAQGQPVERWNLKPDQNFYILGLAPNAARISVRFFFRDSFGNFMKNVNEHHERMDIVRPVYDTRETIPLWQMLRETVNLNSRDKSASPLLAGATARAIFTGQRYPAALLEQTMIRIRAEHEISRGKAAIIKAYFLKNTNKDCPKEVLTVALNESSTNVAYTLGRLFSIYEAVQEAANPGINATIKDKYYNSAAATPAMIFPLLDNLCQKHLRKLNAGNKVWYEKQIRALVSVLGEEYPTRLNLPQQGSFNLGYYHQTQARYEKKEEK